MTRLIITRHGETIWNVEKRVQGSMDSPLTERGVYEAQCLAARLAHEKISAIYASDLPRAQNTAREIALKLNIKAIKFCPELREMNFGEWEGKRWEDLRRERAELFAVWDREPHALQIPGGESMEAVLKRAWTCLTDIIRRHPQDTVCVVSHGITVRLLVNKALGNDLSRILETPWQFNTAVNIFNIDKGIFTAEKIGSCSHLEGKD